MAVSLVSTGVFTSISSTAITVPMPGSTRPAQGTLILLAAYAEITTAFLNTPAGYTTVQGAGGGIGSVSVWYKIAGPSEPTSVTLTLNPATNSANLSGITQVYSGEGSTPINASNVVINSQQSGTITVPTITTTAAGAIVEFVTAATSVTGWPATGYTSRHASPPLFYADAQAKPLGSYGGNAFAYTTPSSPVTGASATILAITTNPSFQASATDSVTLTEVVSRAGSVYLSAADPTFGTDLLSPRGLSMNRFFLDGNSEYIPDPFLISADDPLNPTWTAWIPAAGSVVRSTADTAHATDIATHAPLNKVRFTSDLAPASDVAGPAQFHTSGAQIIGPTGNNFVPVGASLNGAHSMWGGAAVAGLSPVAQHWGWNCIRLVSASVGGPPYLSPAADATTNDDMVSIVNEYTAAGMVVIITLFGVGPGTYNSGSGLTPTDLSYCQAFWNNWATTFKSNTSVWFELLNAPTFPGAGETQAHFGIYDELCSFVRAIAPNNIMVVGGGAYGQDFGAFNTAPVTNSCIQTNAPLLQNKYNNLLFSLYVYDQAGISTSATNAQRDTKLSSYLDGLTSNGIPVLVTETGGIGSDNGTSSPWTAVDLGCQSYYRIRGGRNVGVLGWHGLQGDGANASNFVVPSPNGYFTEINSPTSPTNLSWAGQLLWNAAH